MHSFVTSKNVKWCHLIRATLYSTTAMYGLRVAIPMDVIVTTISLSNTKQRVRASNLETVTIVGSYQR